MQFNSFISIDVVECFCAAFCVFRLVSLSVCPLLLKYVDAFVCSCAVNLLSFTCRD